MLASSAIDCDGGWTMFGARPGLVWYRSVAAAGPGGRRRGEPQGRVGTALGMLDIDVI